MSREIDTRVAVEVMGARWEDRTPKGRKKELLMIGGRGAAYDDGTEIHYYGTVGRETLPHYSTSIADAWLVVEKMRGLGWWLRLSSPFQDGSLWNAGFTPAGTTGWNGTPDHNFASDTAPEAICLAALEAVRAEP